jgi:hypothetical protein
VFVVVVVVVLVVLVGGQGVSTSARVERKNRVSRYPSRVTTQQDKTRQGKARQDIQAVWQSSKSANVYYLRTR